MHVPQALHKQMERFRSALRAGTYDVFHDTDLDGFAAGYLVSKGLEAEGADGILHPVGREGVRVGDSPVILADIAVDEPLAEQLAGREVYAVDHHPWVTADGLVAYVNPHFAGVDNPSRWNAGLLAYLTFRDVLDGKEWIAAVSNIADSCAGPHVDWLLDKYDRDVLVRASRALGSLEYFEGTEHIAYKAFEECEGPEDVLECPEVRKYHERATAELEKYAGNPFAIAEVNDSTKRVLVIPVDSSLRRFQSVVATTLSHAMPDWLVAAYTVEGDVARFSLRFQNAQQRGIHLGELARRAGDLLGGRGGGHAPAAGLRVPATRKEAFIQFLLSSV